MPIKHVAPHIHAAIASLRENLPTAIDAFNAEDGIQLEHVADDGGELRTPGVNFHFGGRVRHAVYPAVEVAVPNGILADLAVGHADGTLAPVLLVSAWVRSVGEEFSERYERLLGYGQLLQHVLLQPDAFGPSVTVNRVEFAYAANPDRRERDEMEHLTIGGHHFFTLDDVEEL